MPSSLDLDDPAAVVVAAAAAMANAKLDALVYGGMALAMYGEPRETRDADLAVAGVDIDDAERAFGSLGLTTAIAFRATRFGGLDIGRISLVGDGQLNMIDLVTPRSARYAQLAMSRPMRGSLDGQELALIAPEDFVIFKVLSTRPKDLEDAQSVLDALRGRLDVDVIRSEISLLADELRDHDVAGRFAQLQS